MFFPGDEPAKFGGAGYGIKTHQVLGLCGA